METEIQPDLLAPFLNRGGNFDPKDWFHLVPIGTFPIARKEGDKVKIYQQVVDGVACDRIVAAFQNRRAKSPAYQMLVGFEHFAHQENGSSAAAGWMAGRSVSCPRWARCTKAMPRSSAAAARRMIASWSVCS